jgi:hypothetical protein
MFDMTIIDGTKVALIDVAFLNPSLDGAMTDAIVAVDTSGNIVKTKDSEDFVSLYSYLGTTSHERDDGIF